MIESDRELVRELRAAAHPIHGEAGDYDSLLEAIGDRRIVLLGEATHGSHEFYHERTRITQRLIREKGFTTLAVEADWPDAYRLNRYVRGIGNDADAVAALGDFRRFPLWMWRNAEVVSLVEWLRSHNAEREAGSPAVGFYGIDLYSLHASIAAVIEYLDEADPDAARRARLRYSCFDRFGEDSQAYGYAASTGATRTCEDEAIQQLVELQRRAGELNARDGRIPEDEFFFAEQNARLIRNAEEYYRSLFGSRTASWKLRDRHMTETIQALVDHFDARGQRTKVIVWAHNSHLGDAAATEMGRRGEWNVGQLVRRVFAGNSFLAGFTTSTGSVAAASDWDAPVELKSIRPPLAGSCEELLRETGISEFFLLLGNGGRIDEALARPRLQRAIGVIYRPDTERISHYFHASLSRQFDALLHFDETSAVAPLDRNSGWHEPDAPETYPFET